MFGVTYVNYIRQRNNLKRETPSDLPKFKIDRNTLILGSYFFSRVGHQSSPKSLK